LASTPDLLNALETTGILLLQDRSFPNIAALVTGESVRGSWWSHPQSHDIFRVVGALADHTDTLVTKLLDAKVTFIHRRLWPAVMAVATSGDSWQRAGLSRQARELLERIEQGSEEQDKPTNVTASGTAAREIETRLLAHGNQIHTDSGRHMVVFETWSSWSRRAGCTTALTDLEARMQLEEAVVRAAGRIAMLPWHRIAASKRARRLQSRD
jgi:hypothetical protein